VRQHVSYLERLGVRFGLGVQVEDRTIAEFLDSGFDAVFLGHGACLGRPLGILGEELSGVHPATAFLARLNLPPDLLPPLLRQPLRLGKRTVVIGGGDTAMDCARSAIRAGAEDVVCVYRRSEAEMPGRAEERRNADEEGVRFLFLVAPVAILPDPTGVRVGGVRFQRVELGPPDASGRARPVAVPGSEFELAADAVVVAAGYAVDPEPVAGLPGVRLTERGTVETTDGGATGRPDVFAAGDNVRGADLVVTAIADAKRAAVHIDDYVRRACRS
jgi:glutamate synthase (NADPH/NADH) small chain